MKMSCYLLAWHQDAVSWHQNTTSESWACNRSNAKLHDSFYCLVNNVRPNPHRCNCPVTNSDNTINLDVLQCAPQFLQLKVLLCFSFPWLHVGACLFAYSKPPLPVRIYSATTKTLCSAVSCILHGSNLWHYIRQHHKWPSDVSRTRLLEPSQDRAFGQRQSHFWEGPFNPFMLSHLWRLHQLLVVNRKKCRNLRWLPFFKILSCSLWISILISPPWNGVL